MAVEKQQANATSPGLRLWQSQRDNILTIGIALLLALLIRAFVAESRFIPSVSMVPTLQVGDRLIVEKISYHFQEPQAGDIVVFEPPEALQRVGFKADQAFIKRIIGEPGDVVRVQAGQVYRNNQPLPEPYIAEPPAYTWGPQQVPANAYLVMGDNRNNSNDSHVWGFLPEDNIIGRAWFRFWPLSSAGLIPNPLRDRLAASNASTQGLQDVAQ